MGVNLQNQKPMPVATSQRKWSDQNCSPKSCVIYFCCVPQSEILLCWIKEKALLCGEEEPPARERTQQVQVKVYRTKSATFWEEPLEASYRRYSALSVIQLTVGERNQPAYLRRLYLHLQIL